MRRALILAGALCGCATLTQLGGPTEPEHCHRQGGYDRGAYDARNGVASRAREIASACDPARVAEIEAAYEEGYASGGGDIGRAPAPTGRCVPNAGVEHLECKFPNKDACNQTATCHWES